MQIDPCANRLLIRVRWPLQVQHMSITESGGMLSHFRRDTMSMDGQMLKSTNILQGFGLFSD
jgi:hypothetical protein